MEKYFGKQVNAFLSVNGIINKNNLLLKEIRANLVYYLYLQTK